MITSSARLFVYVQCRGFNRDLELPQVNVPKPGEPLRSQAIQIRCPFEDCHREETYRVGEMLLGQADQE
jgi:hypothetical protein